MNTLRVLLWLVVTLAHRFPIRADFEVTTPRGTCFVIVRTNGTEVPSPGSDYVWIPTKPGPACANDDGEISRAIEAEIGGLAP